MIQLIRTESVMKDPKPVTLIVANKDYITDSPVIVCTKPPT